MGLFQMLTKIPQTKENTATMNRKMIPMKKSIDMILLLPTHLMQRMILIYQVCTLTKDFFVLSKDANHLSLCVETTSNPTFVGEDTKDCQEHFTGCESNPNHPSGQIRYKLIV